jgi:hypothetical protein
MNDEDFRIGPAERALNAVVIVVAICVLAAAIGGIGWALRRIATDLGALL